MFLGGGRAGSRGFPALYGFQPELTPEPTPPMGSLLSTIAVVRIDRSGQRFRLATTGTIERHSLHVAETVGVRVRVVWACELLNVWVSDASTRREGFGGGGERGGNDKARALQEVDNYFVLKGATFTTANLAMFSTNFRKLPPLVRPLAELIDGLVWEGGGQRDSMTGGERESGERI